MTHPDRFKDQVMVVTGAAQGIGRGVALAAAAQGAQLVLADRSPLVNEVAQEAAALGAQVVVAEVDLETWEGAHTLATRALDDFGRVDILVNNVGGTIWAKPYQEYAPHQIEAEIRRSLFPTLWCCRAILPSMVERRAGAIVNVSSVATRGIYRIPYSAAKGGINALTASLAFEHADDHIRVNAVATGGTEAPPRRVPRNPDPLDEREQAWYRGIVEQTTSSSLMGRYGTIDEQVGAILFLASREASYITGSVLPVAGGDLG